MTIRDDLNLARLLVDLVKQNSGDFPPSVANRIISVCAMALLLEYPGDKRVLKVAAESLVEHPAQKWGNLRERAYEDEPAEG